MSIFARARFHVQDQRRAEFEGLVQELRERTKDEPGTLTYRFFTSDDGSYLVLEEYADTAAALAHNARVADLLARVGQCSTMVEAELYGALGPELRDWVQTHPHVVAFPDFSADGGD